MNSSDFSYLNGSITCASQSKLKYLPRSSSYPDASLPCCLERRRNRNSIGHEGPKPGPRRRKTRAYNPIARAAGDRGATRGTRPKLTGERGLELAGGGRRDATVEEDCVDVDGLDPAAARAVYHGVAVLADYLHGGFLLSESEDGTVRERDS